MEAYEFILVAAAGPVATVTLNRPDKRNALNHAMVANLLAYLQDLRDNPAYRGVRVIVIRAAGNTFCAGTDLDDMAPSHTEDEMRAALAQRDELLRALQSAPQVIVTRVQGAALGGGMGLLCASDITIAGYSATFGMPEVRTGLVPALVAPFIVQRLGLPLTRRLMLTGVQLTVEEAYRCGLVAMACPDNELDECVQGVVADVLRGSPAAVRAAKALLAQLIPPDATLDYRIDLLEQLRTSSEVAEGIAAFHEQRDAAWVLRTDEP